MLRHTYAMEFEVRRRTGYLEVIVRQRRTAEENILATQAILRAIARTGITRVLICVSRSLPIFDVERYNLSEVFGRLAGVPGVRVALVSDTAELFASHEYVEALCRERGLECRAFREREEALDWLVPERCS